MRGTWNLVFYYNVVPEMRAKYHRRPEGAPTLTENDVLRCLGVGDRLFSSDPLEHIYLGLRPYGHLVLVSK